MYSLTYVSSAVAKLSADQLREILEQSRRNNEPQGITGLLLYKGGNFMQVLEGERDVVLRAKERIAKDSRHRGILVLLEGDIEQRSFASWSMAFKDLNAAAGEIPGYDEFLNTSLTDERFVNDPAMSVKLLQIFKRTM